MHGHAHVKQGFYVRTHSCYNLQHEAVTRKILLPAKNKNNNNNSTVMEQTKQKHMATDYQPNECCMA